MRKTRRNIGDAFSPQNIPNSSPVIDPNVASEKGLNEDISVEEIYSSEDKNEQKKTGEEKQTVGRKGEGKTGEGC